MQGAARHSGEIEPRSFRAAWQSALGVIPQALILIGLGAAIWFLGYNTVQNLQSRGITTGFEFLSRVTSLPIPNSWLSYTAGVSTYARAIVIGLIETHVGLGGGNGDQILRIRALAGGELRRHREAVGGVDDLDIVAAQTVHHVEKTAVGADDRIGVSRLEVLGRSARGVDRQDAQGARRIGKISSQNDGRISLRHVRIDVERNGRRRFARRRRRGRRGLAGDLTASGKGEKRKKNER